MKLSQKFIALLLLFFMSQGVLSQPADQPPAQPDAVDPSGGGDKITSGLKQDMRLIFFAALGGAALGLSTLSFVDNPSKELNRVTYGAAMGAIFASVIVLYKVTSGTMSSGVPFNSALDSYSPQNSEGESMENDEEEEDDEEEYDDEFYGGINSLYLISKSSKGFQLYIPIIDLNINEKSKWELRANVFRMTF